MKVSVNGRQHDLSDGITIAQLLERLGANSTGVAVAKNDRVVRRGAFDLEALNDGDRIEIIQAVAGG